MANLVDARISFSNDFADSNVNNSQDLVSRQDQDLMKKYKEAPVSSDFEFNVENFGFVSAADEIFFGGVLLPLEKKKSHERKVTKTTTTTLRQELSGQVQDCVDQTNSKVNARNWWKLGLNKSNKYSSKNNNNNRSQNCLASILESDD